MRSLLMVAGLLVAGHAAADSFDYNLHDYPTAVATADDCRVVARGLAEQFASNAPVDSALGICTDVFESSYDIVIRYESEMRIRPISTLLAGTTLATPGFFATRETCEQALSEERDVFSAETGLPLLFEPYCVDEGGTGNTYPWMFRIEAVGEVANSPRLETAIVFGRIQGHTVATFLEGTMEGMRNLGLNPRYAKFESSIGMGYVVVYLYSAVNYRLETTEFAKLNSVEACELELARFNAAAEGTNTVLTYCTIQNPTARAEVAGIFLDRLPFQMVYSLDQFQDYAACHAGRDAVVDTYRADGLDIADGLCGLDPEGRWKVILLTR